MNIDEVIRVCGRFKSLLHSINRSTVLQLYLKNEFIAAGDRSRTELKDLFKKHLKHIRYLDPDDVLDFIIGVCFDPFVAAYKVSIGTFCAHLKKNYDNIKMLRGTSTGKNRNFQFTTLLREITNNVRCCALFLNS